MYLKKGKKTQRELGSEWGYFGKTKDLMVWSCNMKQLNFRHFNINTKKFAVTVIFFSRMKHKLLPKNNIILFGISRSFRPFATYSHLFQKISENYRIYPKMSKENRRFSRRNPKIFKEQIRIDKANRL